MARLGFNEDNRKRDASSFPKLKLDSNEMARILVIEKEPWSEYVHTLRAPKIVNGQPVEKTEERDGVTTTTLEMDFIGNPICLGDAGILTDEGIDPTNCPMCALAKEGDMVDPPRRRFALNILRYATQPGSVDIKDPFSVDVYVWAFTDMIYNKLLDFTKEWDNLQEHDLLLGPCTNKSFQKFDIGISKKAEWMENTERQAFAVETFKKNHADEEILRAMCGRVAKRSFIEEDLAKVRQRWSVANAARRSHPAIQEAKSLDAGLDDLLTAQTGSADVSTESGTLVDFDAEQATQETEAASLGKPGSSGESIALDDLDSLLDV